MTKGCNLWRKKRRETRQMHNYGELHRTVENPVLTFSYTDDTCVPYILCMRPIIIAMSFLFLERSLARRV